MSVKWIVLCVAAVIISLLQTVEAGRDCSLPEPVLTCEKVLCGLNATCTQCKPNYCNTYTCDNPDGAAVLCTDKCIPVPPTCICNPRFHRLTPDAPCTPLECPEPSTRLTCANVKCAANRECVECDPDECNTYTCDNRDGKGKICTKECNNPGPRCICKPYFHEVDGECVPLDCEDTLPCHY